ncbi:MAG: hypothetical protein QXM75_02890 [Candidatus Diapherotrites archaeon]
MKCHGFNLFTALLAMIIVVTSSMLVLTMIHSERNANTFVENATTDARLEAVARTMRTDALNSFNHYVREEIEYYTSMNPIPIDDLAVWEDWNALIRYFIHGYFGRSGSPMFASQIANSMPEMIRSYKETLTYEARYKVDVVGDEDKLKEAILELIIISAEEEDFIEVIECDGTPQGCPIGSFYINLRLSKLSTDKYESLPRLVVKDLVTGKEIREIILPKTDLKMYVPSRIFKAMAYTRYFLHTDLVNINSSNDYGYLSPRIHNELDSMALGICDYGYCKPRESPYFPPTARYIDGEACPNVGRNQLEAVQGNFRGRSFVYNPSDDRSMNETIEKLFKIRVCELSEKHLAKLSSTKFTIAKTGSIEGVDCYVTFDRVFAEATAAKKVESSLPGLKPQGMLSPQEPNNPNACPFNFTLPQNRNLGYYLEGGKIKWPSEKTVPITRDFCTSLAISGLEQKLRLCQVQGYSCCSEISEASFYITFIEGDANYKVNKNRNVKFMMQIPDMSFTAFNPNYSSGSVLTTLGCALEHQPVAQSCNADQWTCQTYEYQGTFYGCYPKAP